MFGLHMLPRKRFLPLLAMLILVFMGLGPTSAHSKHRDLGPASEYWVDFTGLADIQTVSQLRLEELLPLDNTRRFELGDQGALWVRLSLPALDPANRWFIVLDGSTAIEKAQAFQLDATGTWQTQQAGDHIPVNEWSIPDRRPLFEVIPSRGPGVAWLRLTSHPTPLSQSTYLVDENQLQMARSWTFLLVGGFLGFGLLAQFLGGVFAWLYADRAFVAYMGCVASMLGFQASITGVGGLFFWANSADWNNAATSVFMLWLTAAGVWLVSETCTLSRLQPVLNRFMQLWAVFGFLYPAAYVYLDNTFSLFTLHAYGLLSLLLSLVVCGWAWRLGNGSAGWLALILLPAQIGSAFLSLRTYGLPPDSWTTQYAVLAGTALAIPLLLNILHRRAKELTDNRARVHAIDSADPLTGLPLKPVFELRLQDAIRRARRFHHHSGLLMVEIANHADIEARLGQAAADRALVVAAAHLRQLVRDVDTVCRVQQHRFAVLVEGPRQLEHLKLLAQHILAKGLEPASALADDTRLRFRLAVTALPTPRGIGAEEDERGEAQQHAAQLHAALDSHTEETPKTVIVLNESP